MNKEPVIISMSDVPRREIEWLWPNRIPIAGLTFIIGDPGAGKSYAVYDLLARLSSGRPLPFETNAFLPAVKSILMFERNPSTSVRPRLEDLGANLENIKWLRASRMPNDGKLIRITLADIEIIERAVNDIQPKAVCIDPVIQFVNPKKTNTNAAAEVRELLAPLMEMSYRNGFAFIGIIHCNKGEAVKAIQKVQGSMDFIASADSVFIADDNPENDAGPNEKILCHIKASDTAEQPTLVYRIAQRNGVRQLTWDRISDLTKHDLTGRGVAARGPSQLQIAENFLRAALDTGPRLSSDISALATNCQISERTLSRARASLSIETKEVWDGEKSVWVMLFPKDEARIPEIWQSGRQGQNCGSDLSAKVDKLLESHEKLLDVLGTLGFGREGQWRTQAAKIAPSSESLEVDGKQVAINVSEIMENERQQFESFLHGRNELSRWEAEAWRTWAEVWFGANLIMPSAILN
jgi:AAA domain